MNSSKQRDFQVRNTLKIQGREDSDGNIIYIKDRSGNVVLAENEDGELYGSSLASRVQEITTSGSEDMVISADADHVVVTSGGAGHEVILPAPVVGKKLTIDVGATGFDLQSSAPATIAINGGTGAGYESAIPANSTLFLVCVSATAWKGYYMDADGDVAKIPAAAA